MKRVLALLLAWVGLLQIGGYLSHSIVLKGLGAMTGASPLPLVFDQVDGIEYWASDYRVSLKTQAGDWIERNISAEDYERLPGPHVRHMAYAIPMSLAMVLPERLWLPQLSYGFCGGPLARAFFDFPYPVDAVALHLSSRGAGKAWNWEREFSCTTP